MEIFTIGTLPFNRLACSCGTITGDFERFHFFNLETDFLKNENFFIKTEYRFFVQITTIENVIFPYKTVLSKNQG